MMVNVYEFLLQWHNGCIYIVHLCRLKQFRMNLLVWPFNLFWPPKLAFHVPLVQPRVFGAVPSHVPNSSRPRTVCNARCHRTLEAKPMANGRMRRTSRARVKGAKRSWATCERFGESWMDGAARFRASPLTTLANPYRS